MVQKNYFHLALILLANLLLLVPFVLVWTAMFLLVFLGISGFLGGMFLAVSYLTTFRVNLIPSNLYEHSLLLFSYAFFFIGAGGLLLVVMSRFLPWFLALVKRYYQWNVTFYRRK